MSHNLLDLRHLSAAKPPVVATVRLTVPRSRDFLCVVRCVMMHVGAHTTLSVPHLEDLRVATNEACVLVMDNCDPWQRSVDFRFDELSDGIDMEVRAATDTRYRAPPWIDVNSFSWTLLDALVDSLSWEADATSIAIHLTKHAPQTTSNVN